jgi:TPR repeat protein
MCYERGIHVQRHWQTAAEWYRRAAVQGFKQGYALYKKLSWTMEGETGVWNQLETEVVYELARANILRGPEPANEVDAYRWCLEAAQKGDRYACWRLHEIYLLGQGVEVNRERSAKWLTAALAGSVREPMLSYADMVPPDLKRLLSEHTTLLALRSEMKAIMGRPEATGGRVQLRANGHESRVDI